MRKTKGQQVGNESDGDLDAVRLKNELWDTLKKVKGGER
jgi:hypothetical protein